MHSVVASFCFIVASFDIGGFEEDSVTFLAARRLWTRR